MDVRKGWELRHLAVAARWPPRKVPAAGRRDEVCRSMEAASTGGLSRQLRRLRVPSEGHVHPGGGGGVPLGVLWAKGGTPGGNPPTDEGGRRDKDAP